MAFGKDAYGFIKWNPSGASKVTVGQIHEILDLYEDLKPLTVRQVFYIMVARYGRPKTEAEVTRIGNVVKLMRKSGRMSFDDIRDDGFIEDVPFGYLGAADFYASVRASAAAFRLNRQLGQRRVVELWCEAAGMVPQLVRVAEPLGVPVYCGGGQWSVTGQYQAGARIAERAVPTKVLFISDLDMHGLDIYNKQRKEATQFAEDLGGVVEPEFSRIALTAEQVEHLGLLKAPHRPPKGARGWPLGYYAQAEAIPPTELPGLVRGALEGVLDMEALRRTKRLEKRLRNEVKKATAHLG